jgi:ATP phosphoribosyltransferase regulatory subunit
MNRWLETQKRQSDRLMILLAIANKSGYTLVEPPHFIDYDRFRVHSADLNPSAWIKLNNPEGKVLVLRPDLTTSVMEKLQDLDPSTPLKVCYYASVFHQANQRLEGSKEFGFEYFHAPNIEGEQELLGLLHAIETGLQLSLVVEWSHAGFVKGIAHACGMNEAESLRFKQLLATKDQERLNDWFETLPNTKPYHPLLHSMTSLQGRPQHVIERVRELTDDASLIDLLTPLLPLIPQTPEWVLDLALISEHDYYEGFMFKAYRPQDAAAFIKGGRYLVSYQASSAVGFAFEMNQLEEGTYE